MRTPWQQLPIGEWMTTDCLQNWVLVLPLWPLRDHSEVQFLSKGAWMSTESDNILARKNDSPGLHYGEASLTVRSVRWWGQSQAAGSRERTWVHWEEIKEIVPSLLLSFRDPGWGIHRTGIQIRRGKKRWLQSLTLILGRFCGLRVPYCLSSSPFSFQNKATNSSCFTRCLQHQWANACQSRHMGTTDTHRQTLRKF